MQGIGKENFILERGIRKGAGYGMKSWRLWEKRVKDVEGGV